MAFQVSPGVSVSEYDLTTIVPTVSTTTGAFAGVFRWGPVNEAHLMGSEDQLVNLYGKPTANNFETFFTAANFLGYGNQLYVSRAASDTAYNAVANVGTISANVVVENNNDYLAKEGNPDIPNNSGAFSANTPFVAKYPGYIGNSLEISICDTAAGYSQNINGGYNPANTSYTATNTQGTLAINVNSSSANVTIVSDDSSFATSTAGAVASAINIGDYIPVGNSTIGLQYLQVSGISTVTSNVAGAFAWFNVNFNNVLQLKQNFSNSANGTNAFMTRNWEHFNAVDNAPGISDYVNTRTSNTAIVDQVHIVVTDKLGMFTGVPGQILEVWPNLSRAIDAQGLQGGTIYYRDVLNKSSQYVWSTTDYLGSAVTSNAFPAVSTNSGVETIAFNNGADGLAESSIDISSLAEAYDVFASAESIDISLVLGGKSTTIGDPLGITLPNYIIDNITSSRMDCISFISPYQGAVVANPGNEATSIVAMRNGLRSTSYAVLDSGYKYQYDKYNDLYRWVPLNGDIAGLCVRTDTIRDPWYSPAGFNRGQIKNVVKLAYNPNKADRDLLYKNNINPVVTFPGQGTVLYGDKTLLTQPSAFDRINVRRLFIVLEKAISTAAKYSLFEFNDTFTQASFRNLVTPYLRDIQGRRGITDFKVVCDATNNTPQVVDSNQFVGDIYIKPARSINFIQLNFVAVRTGVDFNEIVGKF